MNGTCQEKSPALAGLFGVASPGIEPGFGASETLVLSIVLRSRGIVYAGGKAAVNKKRQPL